MTQRLEPGAIVVVGPAYRGNGHYEVDGAEGRYRVARRLPPDDYYLVPDLRPPLSDAEWTCIVHVSRLTSEEV